MVVDVDHLGCLVTTDRLGTKGPNNSAKSGGPRHVGRRENSPAFRSQPAKPP